MSSLHLTRLTSSVVAPLSWYERCDTRSGQIGAHTGLQFWRVVWLLSSSAASTPLLNKTTSGRLI